MKKNKKNYKFLILAVLFTVGCTGVTPNVPTTSVSPETNPSTLQTSPTPIQTVSASIIPISSITPTPIFTPTPTPPIATNASQTYGKLHIKNGYLKAPITPYLVSIPFEMKFKMSFDELPIQDKKITVFEIFDDNSTDKKVHYSLNLYTDNNDNKEFILFTQNEKKSITKNIPFNSIEQDKEYEFTFLRNDKKVEFFVDNKSLVSYDFTEDDFIDSIGRRTLLFGSDRNGENKSKILVDYIKITDILSYEFNNNLKDSYKRKLDANFVGEYEYSVNPTPIATATPIGSPTATPLPTATATPLPEKDVSSSVGTATLRLGLKEDSLRGEFVSEGFDFGSSSILNIGNFGDLRFITRMDEIIGNKIEIAGNGSTPKVQVVDLGIKNFEGVKDISNVNFDAKQLYSDDNISTDAIVDHVYAIKTYRYGQKPRYAKVMITNIYTYDYEKKEIQSPEIVQDAQFVNTGGGQSTGFSDGTVYKYYVVAYDGIGETEFSLLQDVSIGANASQNKVTFSFVIPYGAIGYTVYKEYSGGIYKLGPYLAKADSTVNFEDFGRRGITVERLPNRNTTTKSGYRGRDNLEKIEFKYKFNGQGETTFDQAL